MSGALGRVEALAETDRYAGSTLRDHLARWRDRLLASARFRDWAARFPLTRGIARRNARTLFDLCAGFVYSRILFVCVRMRLFDELARGPQSLEAIGRHCNLPLEATERLVRGAVAIGLLEERSGGRFGLGPHGAPMVGNPGLQAMIEHQGMFYEDLRDPIGLLRGDRADTGLSRFWPYAQGADAIPDETEAAAYSALMASSQSLVAQEILQAYPVGRHRRLLDVGGGTGAFVSAVAASAPDIGLELFDLPPVAALARERLTSLGHGARVRIHGGNFKRDPLPAGADLISLVRVVHDHPDADVLALLRAVRATLPAGGCLLLAEPMAGTRGAESVGDAYFGWYLMAMGSGRPRTERELTTMLRAAGFDRVRAHPTRFPLQTGVLVAQVR